MLKALAACAAALSLVVSACASSPAAPDQAAPAETAVVEPEVCRQMIPPGDDAERELCGTPSQWEEFDRRVALLEAGVTCREMLTGSTSNVIKTFCYTPEQWEEFERVQAWESMTQLDGRRGLYGGY